MQSPTVQTGLSLSELFHYFICTVDAIYIRVVCLLGGGGGGVENEFLLLVLMFQYVVVQVQEVPNV